MFYLYVNKYVAKTAVCRNFFPIQTASVAYFQKKNPITRIFCITGRLVVSIKRDKWNSTVLTLKLNVATTDLGTVSCFHCTNCCVTTYRGPVCDCWLMCECSLHCKPHISHLYSFQVILTLYVCMYVCVCVCVCVRVCVCVHMWTRVRACVRVCVHIWMYVYMFVCVYLCMYVSMNVYMYVWMNVCMYIPMYACVHLCM